MYVIHHHGSHLANLHQDLGANIWTGLECTPNPVFVSRDYALPFVPEGIPFPRTFNIMPVQFHIFILATFASLVAPFGGFFASGL